MVARIDSSFQLPFTYLNLSKILVPIILICRFTCRSQISYHIFVYYFIIRTRPTWHIKFCLLFLRPKWGWHLNIFVTPSDFRPLPHPFILYAPWIGGSFMSLGLGQPWPCLDLLPLLPLLFGIVFHLQLVLLSYHSIFLRSYHFLKLVSFLGASPTKTSSVCLWMLKGAI